MATRFKDSIQIGTTAAIALSAGVMLYSLGTIQTQKIEVINQAPAISGTGALTAGSATQYDYNKFMPLTPLTATGGSATYRTLYWAYPETYTGSIMEFAIDVSTAATQTSNNYVDCGVVTAGAAGTGTGLFDNEDLSVGSHQKEPGSTEVVIGPGQAIKCAGLVGTGTSLAGNAYMRYRWTPNN